MRSPNKLLIYLLLSTSAYSCSPELAHPLLNNDMTYMAKPVVIDSVHWGTYISGNLGLSAGFNEYDANHFWELNVHQSYTSKSASFAFGAFGYHGKYTLNADSLQNFSAIQPYFGSYAYYGGGLRGSINFTYPTDRVDVRFIGVDAAWTKE